MPQALKMVHDTDPKAEIMAQVGPHLADIGVLGARVLIAVYMRPTKTAGGIILTDKSKDEDKYQGKVGLVLKMGPIAFKDDATHRFGDVIPVVGDWVVINVGDSFAMELGERRVRNVEDVDVHLIVAKPDAVW